MRNTKPPRQTLQQRLQRDKTRSYALHAHQPAGTKFLKRTFKAKYGRAARDSEELQRWARVQ